VGIKEEEETRHNNARAMDLEFVRTPTVRFALGS